MKTWSTLPKCICYHQECNSNSVLMLFKFQSCSSCSSLLSSWLRTSSAKEETAETAEKIVTTLKSCGDLVDFHLLSKWPYFYVCWKNLPGTYPIHQKKKKHKIHFEGKERKMSRIWVDKRKCEIDNWVVHFEEKYNKRNIPSTSAKT